MHKTLLENWIAKRIHLSTKSQEALRAYQLEKLTHTLAHAKDKSRFYKERLKETDLDTISSLSDFEQVPFTTPLDIRRNAHDFLCVSAHEVERIVTLNTSGTTGDEKRIFFTHEDLEETIDFFHYGMNCLVEKGDKVMVLLPGPSYGSIGDLLKKALSRSNIECVVHGVLQDVEKTAQCIEEHHISCIVGIPMQVRYLSLMKPELFNTHIQKVLLSTDYVPDALVKTLSRNGTCKVFNHYGMTEMGYGGGVECGCLNGYHLRENHLYVEIIDPKTGERVSDGEYGEVVFTTLNRQAMPLIRYKTGDMARFVSQPCGCGTFLRTMEKVRGRMENKININGCEVHLRELDEIILSYDEVMDYKAEYFGENTLHVRLIVGQKSPSKRLEAFIAHALNAQYKGAVSFCIEQFEEDDSLKISNSMIKRKLHDFRNGA
ncbi:MAG: phenylacetate--CoA ligase family protein [Epsilonproteobacteria bacterium]|nr:phenylacetate--CoA ligase family protein [Campylobacterota bacterium]